MLFKKIIVTLHFVLARQSNTPKTEEIITKKNYNMKQKNYLLKLWMLLLCVVAGLGNAAAQAPVNTTLWEETWTGGSAGETPSAYGFEGTTVYGEATLTYAQSSTNTKLYAETTAGGTSPELLLSKSNQTWTISNIPTGQATEMSLTFLSNKTTFAVTSSTTGITISGSQKSWTISATSDVTSFSLTIKNTGSSNARIDNILLKVITAGTSGGGSELTASDLALTGTPVALSFDLYNNSSAQTISYTTSSTGAVTVSGGEGYCTTSVSGNTITVTPSAVTPSAQTITVSQEADDTYAAGTATFTVTITDSTPVPTHTVTFSVNGTTSTQEFEEGASITFPENPADIDGKVFMGWTTEEINGTTDEAPEFVTSETMGESDKTYYAVFAEKTPGTQTTKTDVLTSATTGVTGTNSYSDWSGKTVNSDAVYAGNSAVSSNTSAIQLRSSNSNSGIISTTSGGTLESVTVTWDNGNTAGRSLDIYGSNTAYSKASDLYDSKKQGTKLGSITYNTSTSLTVSGNYSFIGLRSNNGALYLTDISIEWTTGTPDTYSAYCTTVVADTRIEAGISFAEATVTKEITETYNGQALTNPNNVSPITWTSTNEDVATVADGVVTVKAVGETIIKAYFAGDENYKKGEASYTLTINQHILVFTSISLSGEYPQTFFVGDEFSHEGMTVTATYDDNSTQDVTSSARFSGYDMSTPGEQTVTVSYTEGDITKTATYTITVNELPKYTVTFSDGGSVTQASAGEAVTLPTRDAIGEYSFAGWSEANVSEETTTVPTIIPAGSYTPTADITLYPVYTRTEGGGGTTNKTADVTIADYATANNWSNGERYTSITMDENITATGKDNGNNSKYYSTSPGTWRHYASDSGEITITTTSGTLESVTFTYTGNKLTFDGSDVTSGTTVDVSGTSAVFSVSGSSSNTQVSAISVSYTISGGGTTYYWSSPVAAAVERPVITLADNPFYFSTTATITCATEGSTIKYSFDGENWSDYTSALTITETKTIYAKAVKGNDESTVAQVTVTKNLAEPTVTIDATGITNTNAFEGASAGSLSASVKYNDTAIDGATVTWSGNNDAVATINASTGAVTLIGAGSVTFTATYAGNGDYTEKTATYELTVTYDDPNGPGSEQNPYTVAQALDNTPSNGKVYVKGVVSKFVMTGVYSDNYHRYYISDDGSTQSSQLMVFNGKGLNNEDFTSDDDVQIGDIVTIYGNLVLYNTTKEFGAGNYIVSLKRAPAAPTFSPEAGTYTSVQTVEISCATDGAAIYYTTDGTDPTSESTEYTAAIDVNASMTIKAIAVKDDLVSEVATAKYVIDLTPSIVFGNTDNSYSVSYDAGNTNVYYTASNISGDLTLVLCDAYGNATTYDWFRASITSDVYVHVEWDANTDTENARTAYFKLVAGKVESLIYTVTQAKFVADYATLPFEFDGGRNVISTTSGLTQEGLGSDYDSSPKLRFDGTGDYLILKISERPGILTFDIKGNSFSGGTFKVQTSEDGETYTDLKTYTSLSDTKSESFDNLGEDVRCIKWIYATKQNGNVALGNIAIAKYEEQTPEPSITIVPATVEATAAKTEGTLTVTYVDVDTDAEIVWYTDETATATTTSPSWILSEINSTTKNIDYTIQANNGGARTAYLKVYGLDAKGDDVYSNLVTISQEAPSAPAATTKWVLTDIDKLSDTDIVVIVGKTDDDYYAMSNDKGTGNAPEAVKVTVTDNTLSEPIGDNILWNISGNGTNGYTFYPNGESEKWLYCINSNNGVRVGDNTGKTFKIENDYLKHVATSRYVGIYNDQDWRCYTNTTGNIADQTLGFYRKVEPVKFAASGYASYCSSSALDLTPTEDYAAWIVTEVTGTMVKFTKIVGAVPAGTPVILYGQNFGGQTALLPVAKGEPTAIVGNMLRGTLVDTYVDAVEGDYTNFGLSNGKFVRMNSGTVKAHKAFLPILTADLPSNNARMSIVFSDETTGIALNEKMETRNENQIYNLNGQRVETLKKGSLYIVNGKKFVSK